jgi:methyl-accepting chemotaxis protein
MSRVEENVLSMLKAHENLLEASAVGVNTLLEEYSSDVPHEVMRDYFIKMLKVLPDVSFLYYSNNIVWNQPGGYFVLNDDWTPDPDYNQTTRPWFTVAKAHSGSLAYSDPYVDVTDGNLTISISMTLFDAGGRDVGVVSEEITVNAIEGIVNTGSGQNKMYLLDEKGMCIVDADGGKPMETDFFNENKLESFRSLILSQSAFAGGDKRYFIYSTHIPGADYYLVSLMPVSSVFAEVNRLLLVILGVSIGILLVAALATFFITRKMAQPFTALEEFAAVLAEGDFSKISPDYTIKESSRLSLGFNAINQNVSSLIKTIGEQAVLIKNVGSELAERMKTSAAEILGIRENIQGMKERVGTQVVSVNETNETIHMIVGNIEDLNRDIEKQSQNVSRSSAAIEEMAANVASVTHTLVQNGENVERLQSAAEKGHNALQQITADIQEVAKESDNLLEINQMIKSIASQTNLLSMNAAIEAAHAGEVGKGFAVVADEIRKLAESSSKQAKTVSDILKKIKLALDGIGRSSEAMITHFEDIDEEIKTVSEQETNIRMAMEEEDAGNREVLETITALTEITQQVKRRSEEIHGGSRRIISEGKELDAATVELTGSANEIAASIEHISSAVLRADDISDENKQSIAVLIREMSRFKTRDYWLPGRRKNQLAMAKNWGMIVGTKAVDWGVPPLEGVELATLTIAADTALTKAQNTNRTPDMTEACKTAFEALLEKMRFIKNRYFKTPPLSDADIVSLELKPTLSSPPSPPVSRAEADVSRSAPCQFELHLHTVFGSLPDPHQNDYGYRIYYGILAQGGASVEAATGAKRELMKVPVSGNDLPFSRFTRRKKEVFDFAQEDSGKTVYLSIRYENAQGESGPWGPMFSVVIS